MDRDRVLAGATKEDTAFLKMEAIQTISKCLPFLIWKIWTLWLKQLVVTIN